MNHHPSAWGQPLAAHAAFDSHVTFPHHVQNRTTAVNHGMEPRGHTQQPLVTGTSVLALTYEDGIMLAADNLASYGSLARFRDIQRLHPLGTHTLLAAAGDMSDFQYLKKQLDAILIDEGNESHTDGHPSLSAEEIYEFLANLMYSRRSKMNPLWNALLVAGRKDKKSFVGYVDLLGTTYSSPTLATGFGAHIAQPLLREAFEAKAGEDGKGPLLTREEAEKVMDDCMKVLFYRDARSINKYQIATVSDDGVFISESRSSETEWKFAEGLRGYGAQEQ